MTLRTKLRLAIRDLRRRSEAERNAGQNQEGLFADFHDAGSGLMFVFSDRSRTEGGVLVNLTHRPASSASPGAG
jgi:hypothetical protein